MSARAGVVAARGAAPSLLLLPSPSASALAPPPAPPPPAAAASTLLRRLLPRPLLRLVPAWGGGGGGAGGGGGGGRRTRHLVQLLALLLAASGYGLLLASSALAPAQPPPPAPPPPAPAPSAPGTPPRPGLLAQQAVLPRPAEAEVGTELEAVEAAEAVEAVEAELEARRRRVQRVCAERGLAREGQANAWEFFIDSHHSLVWCNVFKAASTAWLYNFNLLGGYSESFLRRSLKPPLALARARFPRPTPAQLRAALLPGAGADPPPLAFLIVREPFERLLSAYRDKLEGLRNRFYRKLGREVAARRHTSPPGPAPPQPLDPKAPSGPTFQQFVDYVIETGLRAPKPRFDEHWAPYYRFCTPCHVNFTVIAKVETLSRDEEYIMERAGLEQALLAAAAARQRSRKVTNRARGARATADLVARYYATITRAQLRDLLRVYGADFDLFGYDASKYFDLVRPDG